MIGKVSFIFFHTFNFLVTFFYLLINEPDRQLKDGVILPVVDEYLSHVLVHSNNSERSKLSKAKNIFGIMEQPTDDQKAAESSKVKDQDGIIDYDTIYKLSVSHVLKCIFGDKMSSNNWRQFIWMLFLRIQIICSDNAVKTDTCLMLALQSATSTHTQKMQLNNL